MTLWWIINQFAWFAWQLTYARRWPMQQRARINRFQLMEKRRTESASSALEIVISRVLINLLLAFCCCRAAVEMLRYTSSLGMQGTVAGCCGSCCRFPSYFQHDVVIICIIYAACTSTRERARAGQWRKQRKISSPRPLPGTAAAHQPKRPRCLAAASGQMTAT
jgi:hypothetical protein